ncbi:MAG: dihydrofolate reductase family protein, partial [Leucobacter sp.]
DDAFRVGCESFLEGSHGGRAHVASDGASHRGLHHSTGHYSHVLATLGKQAPHDRFDTVILGRESYDIARTVGIERPYAHLSEYVATRSAENAPDGVTFTADALQTVRELKQQPGLSIYLCGGGNLAGELLPEIDRLILKRNPVVFGDGIRLFGSPKATIQNFHLTGIRAFDSGVVIEEYTRRQ